MNKSDVVSIEPESRVHLLGSEERWQAVWRFPNGYGVVVSRNEVTRDEPELAIIRFIKVPGRIARDWQFADGQRGIYPGVDGPKILALLAKIREIGVTITLKEVTG